MNFATRPLAILMTLVLFNFLSVSCGSDDDDNEPKNPDTEKPSTPDDDKTNDTDRNKLIVGNWHRSYKNFHQFYRFKPDGSYEVSEALSDGSGHQSTYTYKYEIIAGTDTICLDNSDIHFEVNRTKLTFKYHTGYTGIKEIFNRVEYNSLSECMDNIPSFFPDNSNIYSTDILGNWYTCYIFGSSKTYTLWCFNQDGSCIRQYCHNFDPEYPEIETHNEWYEIQNGILFFYVYNSDNEYDTYWTMTCDPYLEKGNLKIIDSRGEETVFKRTKYDTIEECAANETWCYF